MDNTKRKNRSTGEDGLLYMALVLIMLPVVGSAVGLISLIFGEIHNAADCKSYSGDDYVYYDRSCYRLVGDEIQYADIELKKKIIKAKERSGQ